MSDNKLEKGENFRVEGSLNSDTKSKDSELWKETQKDFDEVAHPGINPLDNAEKKSDVEKNSTDNGNGISVSNP